MSSFDDDSQAALQRILGESRALNRQALRHSARPGDATAGVGLAKPIAEIRACLDSRPAIGFAPAAAGAAARLRLTVALASLPGGDRRQAPRWPLARRGALWLATGEQPVTLLDLGSGGAMLAPVEDLPAFAVLDAMLVLSGDDRVAVRLATDADRLVHLAFLPPGAPMPADLASEMADWAAHYEMAIWQAAALANEVERCFETALSDGGTDADGLFGRHWPQRPDRPDALARRLEDVLAQALTPSAGLAYVLATDSAGHVACDPMRRFDQDRLFDAVGMRAARFSHKAVVQTYRSLPGREPAGVVADIAAPVVVRGRRWGCVRIGRDLQGAPQA